MEYVIPGRSNFLRTGEAVGQRHFREGGRPAGCGEILFDRQAGFTLLEMVVVVFILSLFVAMVIPSFKTTGESALKSDARKTAALLRYLNDSSTYSKETYQLTFNIEDRKMAWKGPDGDKAEDMKSLVGVTLPSKGEVTRGSVTVFFGPLGLTENVAVHLRDKDNVMTVTFNPISGRATIKEG